MSSKERAESVFRLGGTCESVVWQNKEVTNDEHRLLMKCPFAMASGYVLT